MVVILACIVVIAGSLSRLVNRDSLTLTQYAEQNPTPSPKGSEEPKVQPDTDTNIKPSPEPPTSSQTEPSPDPLVSSQTEPSPEPTSPFPMEPVTQLTGAALNGTSMLEQRTSLNEDFYYEPVSDKLKRYMTGISYPNENPDDDADEPQISLDELRYVHILHYDFEGNSVEGELICNEYISQDLLEIFYELYRNEYRLEKVLLIDEYDGDDDLSMEDNNTCCFNYRPVTNSTSLSMHAYGLAIDINPLYNPYISYRLDGSREILPASAQPYADRGLSFPYKIDEDDLCYKLFIQHGFIWGGNWNNIKDYQHFQKSKP